MQYRCRIEAPSDVYPTCINDAKRLNHPLDGSGLEPRLQADERPNSLRQNVIRTQRHAVVCNNLDLTVP